MPLLGQRRNKGGPGCANPPALPRPGGGSCLSPLPPQSTVLAQARRGGVIWAQHGQEGRQEHCCCCLCSVKHRRCTMEVLKLTGQLKKAAAAGGTLREDCTTTAACCYEWPQACFVSQAHRPKSDSASHERAGVFCLLGWVGLCNACLVPFPLSNPESTETRPLLSQLAGLSRVALPATSRLQVRKPNQDFSLRPVNVGR